MRLIPKIGWVYVLWSWNFPWRYKVGFSATPDYRLADIEASMQRAYGTHIKINCFFKLPLLFAQRFENAIHNSGFWRRACNVRGSGYTEWSHWANIVSFLIVYMVAYILNHKCPVYPAALVLVVPVPLDYALFILLFALFQVGVICGGAWLVWWFI